MPAKSNKTKWKPFRSYESTEADQEHTANSVPSRITSNPILSNHHSFLGSNRRAVSDSRIRLPYLDKPLRAAELQKLHEHREREEKAAQVAVPSADTALTPPPVPASLTTQPPEPALRISTNRPSTASKIGLSLKTDEAVVVADLDFSIRLDSAGPFSDENIAAETKCLSSCPDRDPAVAAKGATTAGDDMASATRVSGRPNRFENRPPMSTILCRNGPQCRKLQEGTDLL